MFKAPASLFLGLALLINSIAANAQTDAATAEALMRSSGMWQQLTSIAPQVRAGFLEVLSRSGSSPGQAEIDRLSKTIDVAYDVHRLRATAIATFQTDTKEEHVAAVRRWYASRVGKTVTELEEAASAEQADPRAMVQQGAALLSSMPAKRRAMLDELVVVTHAAETIVQITIDKALAAQRGANSVTPNAPGPSANELRSVLEAQRPQLLQAFTGLSLASYAKAYAALPTPDLAQYIEFLKSEAGKHFTDVGLRAFRAALVEASTELGRGLPGAKDKANT